MVDPGGIVGAVSLALQVVQGLTTYYTNFKSHSEDVENVLSRTKRLQSILLLLQRTASKLDRDDDPVSKETRECIGQCALAVQKLDDYRKKCCHDETTQNTLRNSAKKAAKQVAYPFRKATLDGIQAELSKLLDNLQIIVQALQLDTSILFQERNEKNHQQIQTQITNVDAQQKHHTTLLQSIDIQTLAHSQRSEQSERHIEAHLEDQSLQLMDVNAKQYHHTALLNAHSEQSRESQQRVEACLADQSMQLTSISSALTQLLNGQINPRSYGSSGLGEPSISISRQQPMPSSETACTQYLFEEFRYHYPKTARARRSRLTVGFGFVFSRTFIHNRKCPLYRPGNYTTTFGVRVSVPGRKMRHLFEAAMSLGPGSVSHIITSRNIIDTKSSPAFILIGHFRTVVSRMQNEESLHHLLSSTLRYLLMLFRKGRGRPSDSDDLDGGYLMHNILSIFGYYFDYTLNPTPNLCCQLDQFLRNLSLMGVSLDKQNSYGRTPVDSYIYPYRSTFKANLKSWNIRITTINELEHDLSTVKHDNLVLFKQ